MERDRTKDGFSRRGFIGMGSAALATVAGSLAASSARRAGRPADWQCQD